MKKTIKDMFDEFRRECKTLAKEEDWQNKAVHLSGTKRKRNEFKKYIDKYKSDLDMDIELGVLEEEEKEYCFRTYAIMEKSMEFFKEY